jgi:hypothetical protein
MATSPCTIECGVFGFVLLLQGHCSLINLIHCTLGARLCWFTIWAHALHQNMGCFGMICIYVDTNINVYAHSIMYVCAYV